MAVSRAIHLKGGGTLLIHVDGKRTYIPSKKYRDFRKTYLEPKQFKGKSETEQNCFKLLAQIFGCSVDDKPNPFKKTFVLTGAQVTTRFWKEGDDY